jgi:diaminopimelate epimerase
MCGNGGRCITAFARDLGIIGTHTSFEGIDGAHEASILHNGDIRLKLIDVKGIQQLKDGYLLNTGSPHFVSFVKELEHLDVEHSGRQIRHEARFGREGVNVNFVQRMHAPDSIRVRTFERGVEGETWSCGTGVTAAAISACFDSGNDFPAYKVHTRGGTLEVSFKNPEKGTYSEIYLSGPASHVYDGTIEITV